MSTHDKLAMVAEEAIEQVRYSREQARWLDAVVKSIHDVLEGGRADVGARISPGSGPGQPGQLPGLRLAQLLRRSGL